MIDDLPAELAAAIDADPDDVAAYRVLGDWLQERGDVRGELVAIDLALAAPGADVTALDRQRKAYVKKHAAALFGPLADDALEPELAWRNGFLRHAEVTPWSEQPKFEAFLALPIARFLESLKVWFHAEKHGVAKDNAALVAAMAKAAPRFGALRSLTMTSYSNEDSYRFSHGVGDITAVLAAFPRLEHVELGVLAKLASLDLPHVRSFEASPARHLQALLPAIGAAEWPSLETLYLHACANLGDYHGDPPIKLTQVLPLLSGKRTPKLRHLRLVDMRFGDELVGALARTPLLAQLETLDLSETPLSAKGVVALVAARERFAHLTRLTVHECVDSADAQHAIRDALRCASFEELAS